MDVIEFNPFLCKIIALESVQHFFRNLAGFWYACVNMETTIRAVFSMKGVSSEAFNGVQGFYNDSRVKILHRNGLNSITSIQKLTHAYQNLVRLQKTLSMPV